MTDIDYYIPSVDRLVEFIQTNEDVIKDCNKTCDIQECDLPNSCERNNISFQLGNAMLPRYCNIGEVSIYYYMFFRLNDKKWAEISCMYDKINPKYNLCFCRSYDKYNLSFAEYTPISDFHIEQYMYDVMSNILQCDENVIVNVHTCTSLLKTPIDLKTLLEISSINNQFVRDYNHFIINKFKEDFNSNKQIYILLLCDGLDIPYDIFTVILDLMFEPLHIQTN